MLEADKEYKELSFEKDPLYISMDGNDEEIKVSYDLD